MERGRMREDKLRLNKIIGSNIKRERQLKGLTRDELAEIIDLTTTHLGLIERGERGASHVVLERITQTFGLSYDQLYTDRKKLPEQMKARAEKGSYYDQIFALTSTLDETALAVVADNIKGILMLCNSQKRDVTKN